MTPASPARSTSSGETAVADRPRLVQTKASGVARVIAHLVQLALLAVYTVYQHVVSFLFTPPYRPLAPGAFLGRIAVIGAGITGVSTAAQFRAHGFEVVIFESENELGGIWARVNSTSSLQLNSLMYRFFPSVIWSSAFPQRDEILRELKKVAQRYDLEAVTRFGTKVTKVSRHAKLSTSPEDQGSSKWIINENEREFGIFDAVIGAIGSCGEPSTAVIKGHNRFQGTLVHSSGLDALGDLAGMRVVIVGSGASGVEAAEQAVLHNAHSISVLARDDKWIIPRNTAFDVLLALKPYGAETRLSWIPEKFIRWAHYRDQADISPVKKGLFEGTPIVNDAFLQHIRDGLVTYKRGDTLEITPHGVRFNERERGSSPGSTGIETVIKADVIVLATGYQKPSVEMFPEDLFPVEAGVGGRQYTRPNLYLQNFSVADWSVLFTNASYHDAIGSVGNWHISLYARILMVFLLDKNTRPSPRDMKLWVDILQYLKVASFGAQDTSGLDFFTYTELVIWIVAFHAFRLSRLKWLSFILFGWGVYPSGPSSTKIKSL